MRFSAVSAADFISAAIRLPNADIKIFEPDENGVHANLTEIYRFDIGESSVNFAGSYAVKGFLPGNPVIDEKTGWLTVVATGAESTRLYVLNEKMEVVSELDGIFPGEKIKSTKYSLNGTTALFIITDPKPTVNVASITKRAVVS